MTESHPETAPGAEQATPAPSPAGDDLTGQLAERTADLQRLQAEYLNYKRRVDRDREVVRTNASAAVLSSLLPVLDDLGRADAHGELTGGFKAVADALQQAVASHGLEAFGAAGDAFDPTLHEALMHDYSAEVDEPTADAILQVGFRLGDKILRPARVSVVEPAPVTDAPPAEDGAEVLEDDIEDEDEDEGEVEDVIEGEVEDAGDDLGAESGRRAAAGSSERD